MTSTMKCVVALIVSLGVGAVVVNVDAQSHQPTPAQSTQPSVDRSIPPPGTASAPGQETSFTGTGADLYKTYCAGCHGQTGTGDGPLARNMKKPPPDLTLLAKQNGGVFPSALVYKIIEGREITPGHGGPDMPAWGSVFKASQSGPSEQAVKGRIEALVRHVQSLQQKSS
jgi:mono/diheme cytochrome c family protein